MDPPSPPLKPTSIPPSWSLRQSFFLSYFVLMGYTIITLVEALRTPLVHVRNIMNVETTVSIVASLFYDMFTKEVSKEKVDFNRISEFRYMDWSITTPLILLAILLFYNPQNPVNYLSYLIVVVLDWGMLLAGYWGERGVVSKQTGLWVGFLFFGAMLAFMYACCIDSKANHVVFYIFAAIWSAYGINYMIENEELKNISYNTLDVISKALFGVGLWLFYGKVVSFT